jgi:guanosine-3',5'-bis(diphosphate) 3'-pyrophosphohydrolase
MNNMDELEKKAFDLAKVFHQNQKYGNEPYIKHLEDVVAVLKKFGITNSCLLAAAWLHDAVEDTPLTLERVEEEFGHDVASLVYAVTTEPGKNRKERNAKTYPKIKAKDEAIFLKLADRIANIQASIENDIKKLKMYQNEFPAFKIALKQPGVADEMWSLLEELISTPTS